MNPTAEQAIAIKAKKDDIFNTCADLFRAQKDVEVQSAALNAVNAIEQENARALNRLHFELSKLPGNG